MNCIIPGQNGYERLSPEHAAKLCSLIREDSAAVARAETKLSRDTLSAAAAGFRIHRSTAYVLRAWLDGGAT